MFVGVGHVVVSTARGTDGIHAGVQTGWQSDPGVCRDVGGPWRLSGGSQWWPDRCDGDWLGVRRRTKERSTSTATARCWRARDNVDACVFIVSTGLFSVRFAIPVITCWRNIHSKSNTTPRRCRHLTRTKYWPLFTGELETSSSSTRDSDAAATQTTLRRANKCKTG